MAFVDLCIRPPFSRTLKQYLQTVFPSAVHSGPRAIFSLDSPTFWLTPDSLNLYYLSTSHVRSISVAESFRFVHCTSAQRLSEYRDFLLPPNLRSHPIFSLDHPEQWVSPAHLKCFLERNPNVSGYSDTSISHPSAIQTLSTVDSSEAWRYLVTEICAPIPRPATSVAQLELCLWEFPSAD